MPTPSEKRELRKKLSGTGQQKLMMSLCSSVTARATSDTVEKIPLSTAPKGSFKHYGKHTMGLSLPYSSHGLQSPASRRCQGGHPSYQHGATGDGIGWRTQPVFALGLETITFPSRGNSLGCLFFQTS